MTSLKKKFLSGSVWTILEFGSLKSINLIVQIILARLLVPSDFGLVAMVMLFMIIGEKLSDSGMNASLIRDNEANNKDYSTVFITNVFFSGIIYFLLFISAPFIANFYNQSELISLVRITAISIPLQSLFVVHKMLLIKEMEFKKQVFMEIPTYVLSGAIAIYLAYHGYSYWSLVSLYISRNALMIFSYWIFSSWKPMPYFSWSKMSYHLKFGYKLGFTEVVNTLFEELYSIIIGKKFAATTLGYYNRAVTFQNLPSLIYINTINRAAFPLFSQFQNDKEKLMNSFNMIMGLVTYSYAAIIFILFFNAENLILLLLGEKWLEVIPIFKILCLAAILKPYPYFFVSLLTAKGRSDIVFKIMVISKIIMIIGLIIAMKINFWAMLYFLVINSVFYIVIVYYMSSHSLQIDLKEHIKEMIKLTLFAFIITLLTDYLRNLLDIESYLISFVTYGIIFTSTYILFSLIFKLKVFKNLIILLKDIKLIY